MDNLLSKMAERGLTSRLKNSLYSVILAGSLSLGLAGCGDSSAPIPQPPKPQPRLSQTVSLSNFVDINYGATLTNVASATRKITHNGNQFGDPKTISIPQYNEAFNNMQKGNYSFLLEAPNVNSQTATIDVPNYLPDRDQAYIDSLEKNINQCSEINLNFEPAFSDKNPEDNPVPINSVTSLDGRTQVSFSGYDVAIQTPCETSPGVYKVKLDFGSQEGGLENTVLLGEIIAVPDQIAFWSNRGGNEDIYLGDLINNQLTNIQRLTTHPGQDLEPEWSPDGLELAFTTNRDGPIGIYIRDMDTGNLRSLTPNIDYAKDAAWSPDGSKIAFAYLDFTLSLKGIGLINSNGSGFTKIVEKPFDGTVSDGVSWSIDGQRIFYDMYVGNWDIFSVKSDGSDERNLTNTPYNENLPSVSPQGDKFAFVSDQFGSLDVFIANLDGTGRTRITSDSGVEVDPKFSRDGKQIIFAFDAPLLFNPQLYIMNSDGTGQTQLTTEGQNRYPAWRPR